MSLRLGPPPLLVSVPPIPAHLRCVDAGLELNLQVSNASPFSLAVLPLQRLAVRRRSATFPAALVPPRSGGTS